MWTSREEFERYAADGRAEAAVAQLPPGTTQLPVPKGRATFPESYLPFTTSGAA